MPSPDTLAVKQMIISTWQIKEQCSLSVQVSSLQWLQLRLSFFWAKYTAQEAFIPQSRVQQMLCFQLRRLAWIWSVQLEAHQHTHTLSLLPLAAKTEPCIKCVQSQEKTLDRIYERRQSLHLNTESVELTTMPVRAPLVDMVRSHMAWPVVSLV